MHFLTIRKLQLNLFFCSNFPPFRTGFVRVELLEDHARYHFCRGVEVWDGSKGTNIADSAMKSMGGLLTFLYRLYRYLTQINVRDSRRPRFLNLSKVPEVLGPY